MRSRYLVIFVLGLSVVNQIDAQENEAIENIIVSASKNEQKLEDVITSALVINESEICLLYTSPSPRDLSTSRMPSSA